MLTETTRNNALSEIRDIAGRPAIYRGVVYSGSHSGVVGATDLRTGRRIWQLPLSTITSLWPAGDVVYVTSQGGDIYCVARETGQIYWIKELNRPLRKKFRSDLFRPDSRLEPADRRQRQGFYARLRSEDRRPDRIPAPRRAGPSSLPSPLAVCSMF